MSAGEATVLCVVGIGATVAAVFAHFEPLPVYTAIVAWAARGVGT